MRVLSHNGSPVREEGGGDMYCPHCGETLTFEAVRYQRVLEAVSDGRSLARFWQRVDRHSSATGCWLWTGNLDTHGYGLFLPDRWVRQSAHRFSWLVAGRSLTPGKVLDHLCHNPQCVNPAHLEEVTQYENVMRGRNARIIAHLTGMCARGHPLTGRQIKPNGKVVTFCKICDAENDRRRYPIKAEQRRIRTAARRAAQAQEAGRPLAPRSTSRRLAQPSPSLWDGL
jgi:hypothetical protein